MKKTTLEWYQELPDGYRERAIKNCEEPDMKQDSQADAVGMKARGVTPEGACFWDAVHDHYNYGNPLPPLPTDQTITTSPSEHDGDVFALEITTEGDFALFKRTSMQFNFEGTLVSQSREDLVKLRDLLNQNLK